MRFTPNDKLTFGKYRGIQAGLIYLLAPGYIKWAIGEIPNFCIDQIDFLSSLEVIDC
jgi:hypothetical protein